MKHMLMIVALTATLCFLVAETWALSPAKKPTAKGQAAYKLPDTTAVKWTGDLDGMIRRRMIRVLVTYKPTTLWIGAPSAALPTKPSGVSKTI